MCQTLRVESIEKYWTISKADSEVSNLFAWRKLNHSLIQSEKSDGFRIYEEFWSEFVQSMYCGGKDETFE